MKFETIIGTLALFLSFSSNALAEGKPIVLGDVAPYSTVAFYADAMKAGILLAIDDINKQGGILGRKIELKSKDDKFDPAETRKATLDLITNEKVDFLVGGVGDAACENMSAVAKEKNKLFIATICVGETITNHQFHPNVVRAAVVNLNVGRMLAAHAKKKFPNAKKWAILGSVNGSAREEIEAFRNEMLKLDPKIKFIKEAYVPMGTQDFTANITAMRALKPDAMFVNLLGGDNITFSKQAKGLKLFEKIKLASASAADGAELAATGPDVSEGGIGIDALSMNAEAFAKYKGLEEWNERYKKFSGGKDGFWVSAWGYQAVVTLAEAAKRAKSLDKDKLIAEFDKGFEFSLPWSHVVMRGCDHQAYNDTFQLGTIHYDEKAKKAKLIDVEAYNSMKYAKSCEDVAKDRKDNPNKVF